MNQEIFFEHITSALGKHSCHQYRQMRIHTNYLKKGMSCTSVMGAAYFSKCATLLSWQSRSLMMMTLLHLALRFFEK